MEKSGMALVGDGGKHEMIETPSGQMYITPDVPTLTDIPKNSIIYPDFQKEAEKRSNNSESKGSSSVIDRTPRTINLNMQLPDGGLVKKQLRYKKYRNRSA